MKLTYFKRYRMEIDLAGRDFAVGVPNGYRFLPWDPALLDAHIKAKYAGFRDEIDVNVFPCLGELSGCRRLMRELVGKAGFLPRATWLITCTRNNKRTVQYCGTIQGIRDKEGLGSIQNVAVARGHRNCGLGTCLLAYSLEGFRAAGIRRVYLEATAQNDGAIRLYRRLGFAPVKTVFKAVSESGKLKAESWSK